MLEVNTIEFFFFTRYLHGNGFLFPEERIAFVLDHQDGQRYITCKPAIASTKLLQILKGHQHR